MPPSEAHSPPPVMSVEVHIEWEGETHFAGRLYTTAHNPAVSFEYRPEWLSRADAFAIDPTSLPLRSGAQHGPTLFGAMQDCGPDRWGRMLISRAVRKKILDYKPYQDLDYALALDDASRIGAFRFRTEAAGPFLATRTEKIPPVISLSALLNATDAVHGDTETAKDLRFLLNQGSPLGGARPKSAVVFPDGQLAIAKFPKPDDTRDIAAGEVLALTLAQKAGIRVAAHLLETANGKGISVITRFDRVGARRIPFISGSSLLGLPPGEPGAYTLLADGIRQSGYDTAAELRELWRRLIFSLLISNYDDHLRNHGFLMREPGRWALSPAYDLNPVPEIDRTQTPKMPVSEDDGEPSIAAALAAASRFNLTSTQAQTILREVLVVVSDWRKTGRKLRIKAVTLDAYATAFEHPLLEEARKRS
jgi:serine/threonine-protein kinase HipA